MHSQTAEFIFYFFQYDGLAASSDTGYDLYQVAAVKTPYFAEIVFSF